MIVRQQGNPMSDSQVIRDFWLWFASNLDPITNAYNSSDANWLRTNVSPRIKTLGSPINWEIGPYHDPDYTFVFSPTIRENLPLTRSIVDAAPEIDRWHFLHAKPPKVLQNLHFDSDGHSVSADNWLYTLTAYNAGEFVDIDLYLDAPIPSNKMFSELVVESMLGEEVRLDRVGYITPHVADAVPDNVTPIQHLKDHLDDVLAP